MERPPQVSAVKIIVAVIVLVGLMMALGVIDLSPEVMWGQ